MQASGANQSFQSYSVTPTEPAAAASSSSRPDQVMKRSLSMSLSSSDSMLDPEPKRREVNPVTLQEAMGRLCMQAQELSLLQLMQKLSEFNRAVKPHWDGALEALGEEALFVNISCPQQSRVAPALHANWLDDKRTFAAFMYPSLTCRAAFLEAFVTNCIVSHAHLANDFVVWLQHPETGPLFPMSSETFQMLHGERAMMTEIGEVRVRFEAISAHSNGQLYGQVTLSGVVHNRVVTRALVWPLDSLELSNGAKIVLLSNEDADNYVYVDRESNILHNLTVFSTLWKDFEAISPIELHRLAFRLASAPLASAGCRAGVGRTGTLFVATKMLEWSRANPDKILTNQQILHFIALSRLNRDKQVVQTEQQLALLLDYKNYLNDNPELSISDKMLRLEADMQKECGVPHIMRRKVVAMMAANPAIKEILTNPNRPMSAEDEVLVDQLFGLLEDPISLEEFKDPVVTRQGHTFERSFLVELLNGPMPLCPLTGVALTIDDIRPDIFVQRLRSQLLLRGASFIPVTGQAQAKMQELETFVIKEPLPWCRMLSTVMPPNCYFVRRKGFGGENDFVVEYRGRRRVQKCGFRVNSGGHLQPTAPSTPSFATLDLLIEWLLAKDRANSYPEIARSVTHMQVALLNNTMGKEAFLANLHKDSFLMDLVKHLEMRFEDTVDNAIALIGYVRASILPCSFPCFTYAKKIGNALTKKRLCLHQGQPHVVSSLILHDMRHVEDCRAAITRTIDLPEEQKQKFLLELEQVQARLDFTSGLIALFCPENIPSEKLPLAPLEEGRVTAARQKGYTY